MTTVMLDHSSLASAQSLAVGQRQKVLEEDGASCINVPPWKLQMSRQGTGDAVVTLAAVGCRATGPVWH